MSEFTKKNYAEMLTLLEAAHQSMDQTKAILESMLDVLLNVVQVTYETSSSSVTITEPEYEQLQLFDPSGY